MKNFSVIHILSVALIMQMYQFAGAQDYILTTRGDSISGEVKPQLYGTEKRVQITTTDKKKTTYSLFEIRAFSHSGEIFHPVRGDKGYVFMKLIKPGYLSLYAFQPDNEMRYDGLLLKKLDGEQTVVPNLGFKKFVTRFLDDCPEVSDRVQEGDLGKKDLTEIIDNYNACIASRTVDHKDVIVRRQEQTTKISAWDSLEENIRTKDFSGKTDALDMISEIRKKIQRQEKIPNFLLEGLKNSLQETGLTAELDKAIQEL